jgi:hypothetical protein
MVNVKKNSSLPKVLKYTATDKVERTTSLMSDVADSRRLYRE